MQDNGAHSFTEAANFITEEQLKKEEIYLDLSKLSEEERKEVYFLFPKECFNAVEMTLYHQYLHFDTTVAKDWFTSLFNHDKTEISLSQFKELFQKSAEDAQVENKLNADDLDFITDALSFYFHDAHNNLERKVIGDIEKKNYQYQLEKAKELIKKLTT